MFKKTKKQLSKPKSKKDYIEKLEIKEESDLRKIFQNSGDVFFQSSLYRNEFPLKVTLIGCEGLIDTELLNNLVFERLTLFFQRYPKGKLTIEELKDSLYLPQLAEVNTKEELFADIYSGKLILLIEGFEYLLSANISKRPQRNPEETSAEVTIKGPRDNFIEDLSINVALIRKRMRTNSLSVKYFEVGKRTLTNVAVLYMEDISNPDMVQEISRKIEAIDVDGIYGGNQFMELIEEKPSILFPRHDYSGKPDFAVQCLLKGRLLILIDGVAYTMITPINLFIVLKTSEDNEYTSIYASFERALRLFGIFIAALLPGFWVALTTFHQDQLPLILLATVVESRRGLPLPTALEAITMVIVFEIFKEAGMRLPTSIGSTLSVLGALIIGDAAIRSCLTSPAMLVVIAGSAVATFTLVNQSIIGVISLIRLVAIISASFLGLFAFMLLALFLCAYVSNIRILGVPYMEVSANLSMSNIVKTLFRIPPSSDKRRPSIFSSKDPTKKGEEGHK
ncbi:spore germination protein [Bacillus sp. ISL-57]|uniref:spore germination protein n=1 Tax=Bacillus sp. ISL-57 TaxID=2819135 RepID=UPI0020350493|nr:spore germination protein [Bacillus sp. ISL-57]